MANADEGHSGSEQIPGDEKSNRHEKEIKPDIPDAEGSLTEDANIASSDEASLTRVDDSLSTSLSESPPDGINGSDAAKKDLTKEGHLLKIVSVFDQTFEGAKWATPWVSGDNGQLLFSTDFSARDPDPYRSDAVEIFFVESDDVDLTLTSIQLDFINDIRSLIGLATRMFISPTKNEEQFRVYYVQIFRIAQFGLNSASDSGIAKSAAAVLAAKIIETAEHTQLMKDNTASSLGEGASVSDATASLLGEINSTGEEPQPIILNDAVLPNLSAYAIYVADKDGKTIDMSTEENPEVPPNPHADEAVDIYYAIQPPPNPSPTAKQIAFQLNIDKILRACQRLYLTKSNPDLRKFRIYFVRLFRLAQVGLRSDASAELTNSVLAEIEADLIDDEAAAIKNAHLLALGRYVAIYSILPALIYVFCRLINSPSIIAGMTAMEIDRGVLSSFAILWIGCFIGVWLAYGIRKTKITLRDLTTSDDDRLAPHIRLMFAGLLTMIIGILFTSDFIAFEIGKVSITSIADFPMVAFLLGLFCGISELALPASVAGRATAFVQSVK